LPAAFRAPAGAGAFEAWSNFRATAAPHGSARARVGRVTSRCMQSFRGLTVCGLLAVAWPAAARPSPAVCEAPEPYSFASVAFVAHARAALAPGSGATDQDTRDFALGVAGGAGRFTWGL